MSHYKDLHLTVFLQDFDLYTLWAEETLIEDNLILDILFLVYYESFCDCDAECWKKLCALYEVSFSSYGCTWDNFIY